MLAVKTTFEVFGDGKVFFDEKNEKKLFYVIFLSISWAFEQTNFCQYNTSIMMSPAVLIIRNIPL